MRSELFKFIIVGCVNTIIGMVFIFLLHNICGFGYWMASGTGYILGGICSYFLNKNFTFQYKKRDGRSGIRFFINAVICYFIAYMIAKPFVIKVCNILESNLSTEKQEEVAFLAGAGIYTILNYLGQKFFCFNNKRM